MPLMDLTAQQSASAVRAVDIKPPALQETGWWRTPAASVSDGLLLRMLKWLDCMESDSFDV